MAQLKARLFHRPAEAEWIRDKLKAGTKENKGEGKRKKS
jgi:hypothetical protein